MIGAAIALVCLSALFFALGLAASHRGSDTLYLYRVSSALLFLGVGIAFYAQQDDLIAQIRGLIR